MSGLDTVNVSGKSIKAAITENCTILTVIDIPSHQRTSEALKTMTEKELAAVGLSSHYQIRGGIDVREHNSVVEALKYLDSELRDGEWDRAYIINPERLRYREADRNGSSSSQQARRRPFGRRGKAGG